KQKHASGYDWESLKVRGITPFDFKKLNIRGIIFNTYIMATDGDSFYLIDQHAAHERIFFEKLFRQYSEREKAVQPLLIPFSVTVPPGIEDAQEDWMEMLMNYGFDLEEFGPRTYRVNGIPYFMELSEAEEFINAFTDSISDKTDFADSGQLEKIMQRSCKSAVKAGDVLSENETEALIKDLSNCMNPFSCPHGRPTFICMTKYEIEKMFKRIL
ncbi:MAG: DNA mismatch repair protein MutL, partial [Clostridia bacterium]|nr:DNA mismatch repair protein MutL [Clostridia bacterium]